MMHHYQSHGNNILIYHHYYVHQQLLLEFSKGKDMEHKQEVGSKEGREDKLFLDISLS
jgi:hypothetical protein